MIGDLDSFSSAAVAMDDERGRVVVCARWALVMGCAYLILFSPHGVAPAGLGLIAIFLASNFFLARAPMAVIRSHVFQLTLAGTDTILICAALYLAGAFTVELLVLFLGVLVLAIAGLPSWGIAVATVFMGAAYLLMVWLAGGGAVTWQSSILMRAPFLLGVALSYAALVDAAGGRGDQAKVLAQELIRQLESIRRCQAALAVGARGTVDATLRDMEQRSERALGRTPDKRVEAETAEPVAPFVTA